MAFCPHTAKSLLHSRFSPGPLVRPDGSEGCGASRDAAALCSNQCSDQSALSIDSFGCNDDARKTGTFSILTSAPHWEPFSIPVLFPIIASQSGRTSSWCSDCRPTIEVSIFAFRLFYRFCWELLNCARTKVRTCFFFSQRGLNFVYFLFFGLVFSYLEINQQRRWRESGCEGGEMEGCSAQR